MNAPGNVQYNYAQIEGIWCQAGGNAGAAPIAAAIAMAESGGNTTATDNDSNGTVDRGLWQINSVHGTQSTYDVMGNARAAIAISNNGQNWAPWTTFTNGAYRKFVQANIPADMSAPINATNASANATLTGFPGESTVKGILDPWGIFGDIFNLPQSAANQVDKSIASAIQQAITTILNPFVNIVAGIIGITAGGTMVLVGIFLIVKNTDTGQAAGRAAGTAAQAGMMIAAPETKAATSYVGGGGEPVTVTHTRKPAGSVKIGGRRVQYRPGSVKTEVKRPPKPPKPTKDQLNDTAGEYNNRKEPAE